MTVRDIVDTAERYGVPNAFADVAIRLCNRVVLARIMKALVITEPKPEFLRCDGKYQAGFTNESVLRRLADNPEYEMTHEFLDYSLGKGDECYAILDGDVVAAYSWYSKEPTRIHPPRLVLHVDPRYIYMYKGFTHRSYRGQRLYAIGITRALAAYRERGYEGMICYVESNNFSSLRSCQRMGYRDLGRIYLSAAGGRYLIAHSRGCQQYGLRLEPARGTGYGTAAGAGSLPGGLSGLRPPWQSE